MCVGTILALACAMGAAMQREELNRYWTACWKSPDTGIIAQMDYRWKARVRCVTSQAVWTVVILFIHFNLLAQKTLNRRGLSGIIASFCTQQDVVYLGTSNERR
jgi:hypothetical protein